MNRKQFIRNTSLAAASFAIEPASELFAGTNDVKVRLALIGVGLRGQNHLELVLARADAELVATVSYTHLGHAFQFFSGKYKGRMYVAANHSAGNPQPRSMDYKAHGFYTDDHGKTFHFSEVVNMPGGNESTAADLGHNKLMMNSRNQEGSVRARICLLYTSRCV